MKRVGEYELVREIGSSETGSVWQAKRTALGGAMKLAAVKLFRTESDETAVGHETLLAEARLSMLLNYRNVVQVFDAGVEDGHGYLVMEWVDGLSLSRLLDAMQRRGSVASPVLTAYVVGEILRGLAYAQTITHSGAPLGIVHRSITPDTVLVSVAGEVKLTDFGVAAVGEDEESRPRVARKLRYRAPEQLRRGAREPAVDLYAVGAILHELLDGRPFRGAFDEDELEGFVIEGVVPPLRNPDAVPDQLDALRVGLLQADPERRIGRAKEALKKLMQWPGYRDASAELAELCGAYMGVSAPRSGVHASAVSRRGGSDDGD
jgi:serine/threonine protein kinase